jgi:predicted HTH transcriptional regulator
MPNVEEEHPEALKEQFVPQKPELWKVENYEEFLQKRREMLSEAINEFIENLDTVAEEESYELEDLIERGEDFRIEFKETFLWDVHREQPNKDLKETVAKEICAFANSDGGTLIIGVNDENKEVVGIERDLNVIQKGKDGFELQLNQVISDKMGDKFGSIYTSVEFGEVEGRTVCIISVERSPEPVYFGEQKDFYIRQGSSSKDLNIGEATEYIQERWN